MTNNNRVDLAGEGLDLAIRFGDGAWHGTQAEPVMAAPLTALCAPSVAARLGDPGDLAGRFCYAPIAAMNGRCFLALAPCPVRPCAGRCSTAPR
jgi:LysR family transcriptional regulator of beta-lactamase